MPNASLEFVQVFGTRKCQDTRKAERYFKERGVAKSATQ